MSKRKVEKGRRIIKELTAILQEMSDADVGELLGSVDDLLKAILDYSRVNDYPNIAEFLLANKMRATYIALMRHAINQNYSLKVTRGGHVRFITPTFFQWFEDGVMFLEGLERFAGVVGLYRNKEVRYAIAARDIGPGSEVRPEDLEFIRIEDVRERIKAIPLGQISDLERPVRELRELLEWRETDESKYQELLQKYPWILGAKYEAIQEHKKLDDENIPDFTGVRVHDKCRDIVEIKQPFITLFRRDGAFHSDFNDAWNQVERYLNFAREEKDYLRRKGLVFDNPKCYLLVGFGLSDEKRKKLRNKERLNPAIEILTYNDVLAFAEATIAFVKNLKSEQSKTDER